MNEKINDFMLQEGVRQDSLIHALASQLGTKAGLYMVFAAFVFTAETSLLQIGEKLGFQTSRPLLVLALLFALAGILVLLASIVMLDYKTPPVLPKLQRQTKVYIARLTNIYVPQSEQMERIKGKFVDSLSRSIEHNYQMNHKIGTYLERASWLVGLSILSVLVSLLWGLGRWLLCFLL